MTSKKIKAPVSAFFTPAAAVNFAKSSEGSKSVPFTSLVRSADPISHWYWGRIVHDMKGMKLRKDTCPVDWCHDSNEVMGVGEKFDVSETDGVTVTGRLTPFKDDDRASEVIFKSGEGVPYESSIDWSGPRKLEWIPEGMTALCNGQQFEGPGYIVREWTLNAFAICPLGADDGTLTQFSRDKEIDCEVDGSWPVPTQFKEPSMDPNNPATPPAAPNAPAGNGTQLSATAQVKKEMAVYVTHFGAAKGAEYFMSDKSLTEAFSAHVIDLTAAHKVETEQFQKTIGEKDTRIKELETEFAAFKEQFRGEGKPLSLNDGDKPGQGSKPTHQKFGAGLMDVVRISGAPAK